LPGKDIFRILAFEQAVYDAFPLEPIPESIEDFTTQFSQGCQRLLSGKNWSEVIGRRLNSDVLYVHHSTWLEFLPIKIYKYYLPSHLILASLLFSYEVKTPYHWSVMETLILPPCLDEDVLEDIASELSIQSSLSDSADLRIVAYKEMTFSQRICIAEFLTIYMEFGYADFADRGLEFYKKNIEYWRNSSLPLVAIDGVA